MTTFIISCDISYLDDMVQHITMLGLSNYFIIDRVLGKFPQGEPRLDTAIWPGYNSMIISIVTEDEAEQLKTLILGINQESLTELEYVYWFESPRTSTNLIL
jgi:hypothetical protein